MTESSQMLAEHQPFPLDNKDKNEYEPSPEERKALKLTESLFGKAKNARKVFDEKWLDYYKMFRGKQWKDARPSYRHSEVINLVFRAIQSEVPILTDGMPKPEFIPSEPQDFELARIFNDILDSDWNYNNWSYVLTECVYDANFYGTAFGYLGYDPDKDNGIGGICFESADPFYSFPDPYAKDINDYKTSNSWIYAEPYDVAKAKQEYPDKAQYIKPDLVDLVRRNDKQTAEQVRYKSPTDNRSLLESTNSYDIDQKSEVLKQTTYIHDTEEVEEEVKEIDNETGEERSSFVTKLKYPQGRKIVTMSGVICEDGPLEFEDGKFPYIRLTNYILPREFWGMSEIEQLESPQKIFNKLVSFTLDVLTLMGNPVWIVDTTSGVDTDNLINRPGLVIEKDPNSQVTRQEGVQLQPYVLQIIDRMKLWFDDVSGSSDSSRGVKPEGVTAASAIEALQSASQTRLRLKGRNIDAFMQQFGQMYLSRVGQFYNAPRVFRITNNQNAIQYFKFHVDNVVDEFGNPKRVAKIRKFEQNPVTGQYFEGEEQQFDFMRRFDVRISTGSSMPFQKAKDEQQAFNLFDRQVIDAEELLNVLRYPNKEQILKRMAEKQMQAQMAAMAPQPGAAPADPMAAEPPPQGVM